MTPARAETLRALARATCAGKLHPAGCKSPDDIISHPCAIPGMGRRRADYIAMRAFGGPDAFPSSDLGLRRVLATGRTPPSENEFLNLAENRRPWRDYAAIYCGPQMPVGSGQVAERTEGSDADRAFF
jgi:DNA-3-methyladenine glycosylase II